MDQNQTENTKIDKYAWRKNRRRFAPKSRLGCKTCKIRRIKCDLSRPSCLKCQSTGRSCDGYGEMALACETRAESNQCHYDKTYCAGDRSTSAVVKQHRQWPTENHSLSMQNLGSFMVLPVTGSMQTEAMCFFECISIKHLSEYQPCESWRKTLMFFSQTVPSVRHAATALGLLHWNYLNGSTPDRIYLPQSSRGLRELDNAPLLHYNRAIQLLLNQDVGDDSIENIAITLLVCYLFTCFDHLGGNDGQAMKHLRGGVELSLKIENSVLDSKMTSIDPCDEGKPSDIYTLMHLVTRQIRRLDKQAVMFLLDWDPADIEEPLLPGSLPFGNAFQSVDQAADHLHVLIARIMRLRNTDEQMYPTGKIMPLPSRSSYKEIVLKQLEEWSMLFENTLQQDGSSSREIESEIDPLVMLLRLQHTVAWIFLSSYGPGREMNFDHFLPAFQQCVEWASNAVAAHERYSGSLKPTFTPEIRLLPVLYIIGAKCRHPLVRREVVTILRRQSIREAVWSSIYTARVIERIIEIEESGPNTGEIIQSMDQIAVWHRIEAISWVNPPHGQSPTGLDLTYMFCTREEIYNEVLLI